LFGRALCEVADVNFYVNKGLLLLRKKSQSVKTPLRSKKAKLLSWLGLTRP